MTLYFCIIIILIFGGLTLKRKSYFFLSVLLLTFVAGLRHPSMGLGDVEKVYYMQYIQTETMPLGNMFSSFSSGTGYLLLMKVFTSLGMPYQLFLFFNSALFVIAAERLMYQFSKDYLVGQIVFISSAYLFSFVLIRQYMAISFLLFAYPYLLKRKSIPYCILVLVASIFHYTVIITLLLYPFVRYFRHGLASCIVILIGLIFGVLSPNFILQIVKIVFPQLYEYYEFGIYSQGNGISWGWFLILLLPVVLYFVSYTRRQDINATSELASVEKDLLLVNSVGIAIFCFSSIIVEFYRVSQYFTIPYMVLLPNIVYCLEKNKNIRWIIRIALICAFIIYMLRFAVYNVSCVSYKFFWM